MAAGPINVLGFRALLCAALGGDDDEKDDVGCLPPLIQDCAKELEDAFRANSPHRVKESSAKSVALPSGLMREVLDALETVPPSKRRRATAFLISYLARSRVAFTTNDTSSIAMEVVRAIALKAMKKWRPSEMLKERNDATVDKLKIFMYSRNAGGEIVADIPKEVEWVEDDAEKLADEVAEELADAIEDRCDFSLSHAVCKLVAKKILCRAHDACDGMEGPLSDVLGAVLAYVVDGGRLAAAAPPQLTDDLDDIWPALEAFVEEIWFNDASFHAHVAQCGRDLLADAAAANDCERGAEKCSNLEFLRDPRDTCPRCAGSSWETSFRNVRASDEAAEHIRICARCGYEVGR
jgi:hypothetical protein